MVSQRFIHKRECLCRLISVKDPLHQLKARKKNEKGEYCGRCKTGVSPVRAWDICGCEEPIQKSALRNLKYQFNFPRFGSETLDYNLFSEKRIPKVAMKILSLFVENLSARKGLETHSFRGSDGSAEWG